MLTPENHYPPLQTPADVLKFIQATQAFTTDEKKILAFVQKLGYINNALCRQLFGANRNRATYLLKKMTGEGRLVRVGANRATSYRLSPPE